MSNRAESKPRVSRRGSRNCAGDTADLFEYFTALGLAEEQAARKPELRRCSKCRVEKSAKDDFHWIKGKASKRKPYAYCKPCAVETRRENARRQREGDPEDRRTVASR